MSHDSKMCATLETITYKPGKHQSAYDLTEKLLSEFRAIPGRLQMISAWNTDGVEYVLHIWESPEAKAAASEALNALGEKYEDVFEGFESVDLENVWYIVDQMTEA
jgi:hypothetical protein